MCMLPTTCQWQREEVAATRTGWNWRANAALGRNSKQILMRRTRTPTYLQTWTSWGHNTMSAIRVTGNIHLLKNQSHLTSGNNTYRHTHHSKVQPCVVNSLPWLHTVEVKQNTVLQPIQQWDLLKWRSSLFQNWMATSLNSRSYSSSSYQLPSPEAGTRLYRLGF